MRNLLLTAVLAVACWSPAAAQKKPVTLESLPGARSRAGIAAVWSPAGDRFVYTEGDTLHLLDCPSGKDSDIIRLSRLRSAAVKTPEPEIFDWTNRRVAAEPIQWFPSGKELLVSEGGDLFIVPVAASDDAPFTQLTSTAGVEEDAKLSPDGKLVGFRRGHDLYVLRIRDHKVTRLTSDGSPTLLNGEMDWVYPEELELPTAWWWSPDSRRIAYMQFDITREPIFPEVSLLNVRGKLEPERYPQPGDPNPEVRIGVVAAEGGATRWLDLGDTRDRLLARVEWLPAHGAMSGSVAIERLNRVQNQLDLLVADTKSGASHVLLHEEDPYWINVNNHLHFFADGERFLWGSERDGFLHLYLYGTDGKLERQVTRGDWQVEKVLQVDETRGVVYYQSTEASPLESQFYAISLNGNSKHRLTTEKGTHSIQMSPALSYWTDTFSSLTAPPRTALYRSGGAESGSEVMVLRKPDTSYEEYDLQTPEIHTFKTADGVSLYGRLIKPAGFTAGFAAGHKYPVIVEVYGGPGAQSIHDKWLGLAWEQALAQRGFVVWQVDNRGSTGRGHKFESAIFRNLGERELADQLAGLELSAFARLHRSPAGWTVWLELRRVHDAVFPVQRTGSLPGGCVGSAGDQLADL